MEIQTRFNGDYPVFDLNGQLVLGQATRNLRNAIRNAAERNPEKIVVNLRDVTFVDSCGLGELVSSYSHVQSRGGKLVLLGPRDRVMSLLILTKLETVFDIYKDEATTIADSPQYKTSAQSGNAR